ncbi:unnamed protein product, partial [marine sediment metagenome]
MEQQMSWVIRREMLKRKVVEQRQINLQTISNNANKVIRSSFTARKTVDDFPNILSYLNRLFPAVDVFDVIIYTSSP